ncbi:MAG: hypothetical protein GQ529_07150 [Methyloprofundus sp.]|nr:hypothetical protein [Methyloprofundus sp.]
MPVKKRGQELAIQSLVTRSDPVQESAYLTIIPCLYAFLLLGYGEYDE